MKKVKHYISNGKSDYEIWGEGGSVVRIFRVRTGTYIFGRCYWVSHIIRHKLLLIVYKWPANTDE